jgi:hypothetical protein
VLSVERDVCHVSTPGDDVTLDGTIPPVFLLDKTERTLRYGQPTTQHGNKNGSKI